MRRDQRLDDKFVEAPVVVGQRRQIDAAVPAHQKADVRGQALQERVGDVQTGSARPRGDAHREPRVLDVGRHGVRGAMGGERSVWPVPPARPFLLAVLLPRRRHALQSVAGPACPAEFRGSAACSTWNDGAGCRHRPSSPWWGRVRSVRRVLGGAAGSILWCRSRPPGPPNGSPAAASDVHLRLHAGGGHVRGPGGGAPLFLTCTPDGWLDALCPSPVDYGPAGSGDRTLDLRAEFGGTR